MTEPPRGSLAVADAGAWRLKIFDELPSTANLCSRLADAGEPEGLAIMARRQTAGRGTRGRQWEGAGGNLFLSALLRPDEPAPAAAQWSLLAGVAVADVLAGLLPAGAAIGLKWPNDVLLHGGKLAGILVESTASGDGRLNWLSVGIGINLATAPHLPDRATACVADLVPPPPPEAVARDVLAAVARWRDLRSRHGFAPVREAFLRRAAKPGTLLTLVTGERRIAGAFAGLGEDGALLVCLDGQLRSFVAAEVSIENGS